ncbi:hypothetical protein VNO77_33629 [Canavalia gladiata]|uniref:Uncharacterized protein n=1 Tax=Canavalia gladiata TaxID=3824 RepID=A0AAN9KF89_CANGL
MPSSQRKYSISKACIKWLKEGDDNTKFFHALYRKQLPTERLKERCHEVKADSSTLTNSDKSAGSRGSSTPELSTMYNDTIKHLPPISTVWSNDQSLSPTTNRKVFQFENEECEGFKMMENIKTGSWNWMKLRSLDTLYSQIDSYAPVVA